ncbi:unnamed protein product, partial [Rotaria magnacalcarata]
MAALGQRLQTVEKLAGPRRETLTDEKLSRKNTLDAVGVETHEDD